MQRTAPYLDGVFGTSELVASRRRARRVARGVRATIVDADRRAAVAARRSAAKAIASPSASPHLRAFVNVQRGCSYYCTYCIVPYVRGRFDNRPLARHRRGGRTRDRARRARSDARRPDGQRVPGARERRRFRRLARDGRRASRDSTALTFLTSHPKDFTPKLARTLGALPFAAAALPSARAVRLRSDPAPHEPEVYRRRSIAKRSRLFREHCPHWALTTDLIVGFPGESDDDFARDAGAVRGDGVRASLHVRLFAAPRHAGRPLGADSAPMSATRACAHWRATVDRGVRAWHARKRGTRRARARSGTVAQRPRQACRQNDATT